MLHRFLIAVQEEGLVRLRARVGVSRNHHRIKASEANKTTKVPEGSVPRRSRRLRILTSRWTRGSRAGMSSRLRCLKKFLTLNFLLICYNLMKISRCL